MKKVIEAIEDVDPGTRLMIGGLALIVMLFWLIACAVTGTKLF